MDNNIFTSIQNDIKELKSLLVNQSTYTTTKEYLSADEAADFLSIQKSYLYKLVHQGVIGRHKPFGKLLYFKIEDLKTFIESGKIKSRTEIEREADLYLLKSKHK